MVGRTVLVTGGTGGIGRATALGLAGMGANVAITGRDATRAEDAASEIRAATGAQVDVFLADHSSQADVRRLADEMLQRLTRVDVLVNNVGGYWNTRHVTVDGLERTFAVNHLAAFLLTDLLLALLQQSDRARVVTVASHAHAQGRIDFDDLQGEHAYSGARAYNQSKLASVLFSYELAQAAARQRGHVQRCAPRRREHGVRRRGPRQNATGAGTDSPPFHEDCPTRCRDFDPRGFRSTAPRRHRVLLHEQPTPQVISTESRPPRSVEAVACQRGLG